MSLATITGGSSGQLAAVDSNALRVRVKTDFDLAVEAGLAFSWSNLTYDPGAADTILAVENNSTTYDLYIQKIILSSDTTSQMVVHTSSGVTMAGTAIVGTNLNRGSSFVAPATADANETGNGQAAATYSGRVMTLTVLANQTVAIDVNGGIVLPYDWTMGVDLTTAATASNCTFIGYFKARA